MIESPGSNQPVRLSRKQLLISALATVFGAVAVTILFVLPAEFGVDPTGIGNKLGLVDLINDESDQASSEPAPTSGAYPEIPVDFDYYEPQVMEDPYSRLQDARFRSETLSIRLGVVEQVEYKLRMGQGDAVVYSWQVDSGFVYTDFHADPGGNDQYPDRYWIRYSEGEFNRGAGSLVAPFAGNHGWYWLNIEDHPVTITLEVNGFYDSIDELMRSKQD